MQKPLVTVAAAMAAAIMSLPLGAETITVGSTAYEVTRNEKQLAKGVKYTELLFPGHTYTGYTGGGRVHVIEADMTEPTVKLEMINNGSMSGNRTLANHAASVSKTGYKVVGGANGNFWITSEQPWKSQTSGWPHGVAIRNGSMFTDPNTKTDPHCGGPTVTGMLAVDENGKVYMTARSRSSPTTIRARVSRFRRFILPQATHLTLICVTAMSRRARHQSTTATTARHGLSSR